MGGVLATAGLAAAPLVLIVALMLGPRWSAAWAGVAGFALAALLASTATGLGGPPPVPGLPGPVAGPMIGVLAESGFTAATILWILWPALALHEHQQRCGALDALRAGLGRLTGERPLQILFVGWFAALFLEGAAGFGTPVALVAPILTGLGVAPVRAVVLALLGHAAGVSFGALGTPVLAQVALTGIDAAGIAWRTALLHAVSGSLLMAFFVRTLREDGPRPAAPVIGWAAFAAAAFLLPSLAFAALIGPELATLGGALAGGAAFVALLRCRAMRRGPPASDGAASAPNPTGSTSAALAAPASAALGLRRALWPYVVLVALVLVTRALPALSEALGSVVVQWRLFERFEGRMLPLTHPGTLLFVALLVGAGMQGVSARQLLPSLARAARRLLPVSAALFAMLALSRLMLHAGMIDALERGVVAGLGQGWPFVAPAVGALGSFVTGSATASNVLFSTLQAQTALGLGLPVATMLAAQGFGAAIGNVVCPHNIVAGAATVGLAGREADVLRHTLLPCAAYLALGGMLVAAWTAR